MPNPNTAIRRPQYTTMRCIPEDVPMAHAVMFYEMFGNQPRLCVPCATNIQSEYHVAMRVVASGCRCSACGATE